jgi:Domain of unknown function (DUF6602)
MLRTVAELLEAFLEKEVARLDLLKITHPPTIGAVFEGLTRTVLNLALPLEPTLSIVSGLARAVDGSLTDELDAMLVTGEGEDIPYDGKKIYPIDQVLAVVEVKKNLYTCDLAAGHENLRTARQQGKEVPRLSREDH